MSVFAIFRTCKNIIYPLDKAYKSFWHMPFQKKNNCLLLINSGFIRKLD